MADPANPGDPDFSMPKDSESAEGGFTPPAESDLTDDAADVEAEIAATAFGTDLAALKAEIEARLTTTARAATDDGWVQSVGSDNIVGVGYTSIDATQLAAGRATTDPGAPGLMLFTYERVPTEQLRAEVAQVAGSRAIDTVPIIQYQTGVVDAFSHRMRMRPAPGGISVGHTAVTAGTLGCLVTGRSAPRNQRLMVLSNNHVLANSNAAALGNSIIQQGSFDGGAHPGSQIAILERFIPINFAGGANYVDCATGWAWPDRVRRELMYLSGTTPRFFRMGALVKSPFIGMIVGKTGRTTQLRQGRVTAVGVTVNVNFGGGRIGQFRDQFSVVGFAGDFSQGGDSGSAIWEWNAQRAAVGLLFAGGGGTTFGNRMSRVLASLDVNLVV